MNLEKNNKTTTTTTTTTTTAAAAAAAIRDFGPIIRYISQMIQHSLSP